MKELYAVSIMSKRSGGPNVTEVGHGAYAFFANSEHEATGKAMSLAKEKFIAADGWATPSVSVVFIPVFMCREAVEEYEKHLPDWLKDEGVSK